MAKRVLIVEDEIINAMALSATIPKWGCLVVDMVTSGEDAVRAAEAHQPDVVLMDINIHGAIDGLDAAREIIGRLGIPVIFMTGYDDDKTVRAARDLKPLAFLVKPLNANRLKELLTGP
ncbi:MAG: response regulator [Deltaproteobacteria bacterium]